MGRTLLGSAVLLGCFIWGCSYKPASDADKPGVGVHEHGVYVTAPLESDVGTNEVVAAQDQFSPPDAPPDVPGSGDIAPEAMAPDMSSPMDCLSNPIDCTDGVVPSVDAPPLEDIGDPGCPAGMVGITDLFCMDRYEAALVLTSEEGPEAMWSPYLNPGQESVRAISAPKLVPQGYINQLQAKAACSGAAKRLCSDVEWLRACRGPDETTYPYGPSYEPGMCNDTRECHPIVQLFETTADWIWSELGNSCVNQLPQGLSKTGAFPQCISAEGALDLAGSLHEWTDAATGTFRGGFYVDATTNGPGCLYKTTAHNVAHWDYSTGFRCCADRGPSF